MSNIYFNSSQFPSIIHMDDYSYGIDLIVTLIKDSDELFILDRIE